MPVVDGYIDRDALKKRAGLSLDDDEFDELIDKAINAASRGIDVFTKRHFYQVAEARVFTADTSDIVQFGTYNDLVSVTALETDTTGDGSFETAWTPADYELHPVNATAGPEQRPYRYAQAVGTLRFPISRKTVGRRNLVRIDGTWGWPAVPASVIEACEIQAHRLFKRREAPEGVVGLNMFGTVRMGRLDPDVGGLVKPYRIRVVG